MQQLSLTESKGTFRLIRSCIRELPFAHSLLGKRLRGWRFNRFTRQCVRYIRSKNGTVIVNEGQGLAIVVPIACEKDQQPTISWWQSLASLPLKRIGAITRFRRRMQRYMPSEPHLSLMLLIPEEKRNGMSMVIELRDELFKLSEVMQLPIYAQTYSPRTRLLFESFGFFTYGRVPVPSGNEYVYFLKREPAI